MNVNRSKLSRSIFGLLIILAGFIYMLFNLKILPANWLHIVFSWPMLLIMLGLWHFLVHKHNYIFSLLILGVGVIFLLPKIWNVLGFTCYYSDFVSVIGWPIIIIIIGLWILFKSTHLNKNNNYRRFNKDNYKGCNRHVIDNDFIDYSVVMNGIEEIYLNSIFKGGEINCIMGGVQLDLRKTNLPEGISKLTLNAIFGGVTLLVPETWNVEIIMSSSMLGGFADKRQIKGVVDENKKLIIETKFLLGGGEIR